jgi:hypothetical protein
MVAPMFGFSFLSVLYLQRVLGYDPAAVGLAGLPLAALLAAVSLGLSARLVTRLGLRAVLLIGLTLIAAGLALFARVPVHGRYIADILPVMLLIGGGAGLAMPALMGFAMSSAIPSDAGLVSGLFATGAQLGGALGLAILAALATARANALRAGGQATAPALTGGYHLASGVSAAIAGAGILLAATVLRPPADLDHRRPAADLDHRRPARCACVYPGRKRRVIKIAWAPRCCCPAALGARRIVDSDGHSAGAQGEDGAVLRRAVPDRRDGDRDADAGLERTGRRAHAQARRLRDRERRDRPAVGGQGEGRAGLAARRRLLQYHGRRRGLQGAGRRLRRR